MHDIGWDVADDDFVVNIDLIGGERMDDGGWLTTEGG